MTNLRHLILQSPIGTTISGIHFLNTANIQVPFSNAANTGTLVVPPNTLTSFRVLWETATGQNLELYLRENSVDKIIIANTTNPYSYLFARSLASAFNSPFSTVNSGSLRIDSKGNTENVALAGSTSFGPFLSRNSALVINGGTYTKSVSSPAPGRKKVVINSTNTSYGLLIRVVAKDATAPGAAIASEASFLLSARQGEGINVELQFNDQVDIYIANTSGSGAITQTIVFEEY